MTTVNSSAYRTPLLEIDDGPNRLAGTVLPQDELSVAEREQMYGLFHQYFEDVSWARFEQDLDEKEWVILLAEAGNSRIHGFSTLMRLRTVIDDEPVTAYFSGDTIIARDHWGETVLPRLWAPNTSLAWRKGSPIGRVYWFLICSGYKTYRYLPVFFRQFYPTCRRPTPPDIKRSLDKLGALKFGTEYDAAAGYCALPACYTAALRCRPDYAQAAQGPAHCLFCAGQSRPHKRRRIGLSCRT